eukprot:Rhum_TRINITY_DN12216_c0_g1::Rhum_TRINITY_DN12216_c0_g1_i1::g.50147::m.50147
MSPTHFTLHPLRPKVLRERLLHDVTSPLPKGGVAADSAEHSTPEAAPLPLQRVLPLRLSIQALLPVLVVQTLRQEQRSERANRNVGALEGRHLRDEHCSARQPRDGARRRRVAVVPGVVLLGVEVALQPPRQSGDGTGAEVGAEGKRGADVPRDREEEDGEQQGVADVVHCAAVDEAPQQEDRDVHVRPTGEAVVRVEDRLLHPQRIRRPLVMHSKRERAAVGRQRRHDKRRRQRRPVRGREFHCCVDNGKSTLQGRGLREGGEGLLCTTRHKDQVRRRREAAVPAPSPPYLFMPHAAYFLAVASSVGAKLNRSVPLPRPSGYQATFHGRRNPRYDSDKGLPLTTTQWRAFFCEPTMRPPLKNSAVSLCTLRPGL